MMHLPVGDFNSNNPFLNILDLIKTPLMRFPVTTVAHQTDFTVCVTCTVTLCFQEEGFVSAGLQDKG